MLVQAGCSVSDPELVYEISHNLVQKEWHPEFGYTCCASQRRRRAFPARDIRRCKGRCGKQTGHPVLIPAVATKTRSCLSCDAGECGAAGLFWSTSWRGRQLSRSEWRTRRLSQKSIDGCNTETWGSGKPRRTGSVSDEAAACYKSSKDVVQAVLDANFWREVEKRVVRCRR